MYEQNQYSYELNPEMLKQIAAVFEPFAFDFGMENTI